MNFRLQSTNELNGRSIRERNHSVDRAPVVAPITTPIRHRCGHVVEHDLEGQPEWAAKHRARRICVFCYTGRPVPSAGRAPVGEGCPAPASVVAPVPTTREEGLPRAAAALLDLSVERPEWAAAARLVFGRLASHGQEWWAEWGGVALADLRAIVAEWAATLAGRGPLTLA